MKNMTRRDFLGVAGATAAGLALLVEMLVYLLLAIGSLLMLIVNIAAIVAMF